MLGIEDELIDEGGLGNSKGLPELLAGASALDEQTEAKVLENLRQLHNRTVIIVTHRKAALDICNRIVEMDAGRIREIDGNGQDL